MRQIERMIAINDYYSYVLKKSWTWDRLTEDERHRFNSLSLDNIKSTRTAYETKEMVNLIYTAFLEGCGYKPTGWRETDPEPIPFC